MHIFLPYRFESIIMKIWYFIWKRHAGSFLGYNIPRSLFLLHSYWSRSICVFPKELESDYQLYIPVSDFSFALQNLEYAICCVKKIPCLTSRKWGSIKVYRQVIIYNWNLLQATYKICQSSLCHSGFQLSVNRKYQLPS